MKLQVRKQTLAIVQTQFEGFHCWAAAPAAVNYLRNRHRHIFHVKFAVRVGHDDRAVEFHMLRTTLNEEIEVVSQKLRDEPFKSCEMLAGEIAARMWERVDNLDIAFVEVWEDNENGARIDYEQR